RFFSWTGFHAHVRLRRPRFEVAHKAIDRAVAARKRVLLAENVINRLTLHAALPQGNDLVAERRHFRRDRRRRTHWQRRLQLRLQRRRIGQGRRQHIVLLRPPPVLAYRLTTHLQVTSDLSIGFAELQASNQLTNFQHVRSPSRQGPLRPSQANGLSSTRRRGEQQARRGPNRAATTGPRSRENRWPPIARKGVAPIRAKTPGPQWAKTSGYYRALTDTPHSRAASRTDPPGTTSDDGTFRGLPSRLPCARARARPASTRSRMRSRSNSAIAPKMCIWSLPAGVVASIPSFNETKAIPSAWNSSSSVIKCRRLRPS